MAAYVRIQTVAVDKSNVYLLIFYSCNTLMLYQIRLQGRSSKEELLETKRVKGKVRKTEEEYFEVAF